LHLNDLQGNALLLDDSMELGVASGISAVMNSGEVLRLRGEDREKREDLGRARVWRRRHHFIGTQERRRGS
jgi:hypothetical protein